MSVIDGNRSVPALVEATLADSPAEEPNKFFVAKAVRLSEGLPPQEARSLAPFLFAPDLERIFLCVREGRFYRLRVAGNGFALLFGREITGLTLDEAFSAWPQLLEAERARAEHVFGEFRVGVVRGVVTYDDGQRVSFETVKVPVGGNGDVAFGLGRLEVRRT